MRLRAVIVVSLLLLVSIVLQSSLFTRTGVFQPDLVMLLVIVLGLTRLRPETVLAVGFAAGLVVDLLGTSVLGLRAVVYVLVAYAALKAHRRAEGGRVNTAVWAGAVTLLGVIILLTLGTLFGQGLLLGEGVVSRTLVVPIANAILGFAFAPMLVRLVDHDSGAFRYA